MKFKIEKGTGTFNKLIALRNEIKLVRDQAFAVVQEFGANEFCKAQWSLAGGIAAIKFDNPPEGWKILDKYQNLYYPKAKNKVALLKFATLTTIPYSALNDIVGFLGNQTVPYGQGICWVNTVGMKFGENYMLMEVREGAKYKAIPDVIEILESEFEILSKSIDEENINNVIS